MEHPPHAHDSPWPAPPLHPALKPQSVHVWRASLEQPDPIYLRLVQLLSTDEQERASRFHFERDRRRFATGRGVLRSIIGAYLAVSPTQVAFCYGPRGKPALALPAGQGALRFNISHSHNLALFAFARDQEVGVDVEHVHVVPDADEIAQRFFSSAEYAVLASLQPEQRQEAFFNCWTRKEAYIKVIGNGLAQPLDRFDVTLAPGDPARLLRVEGDEARAQRWTMLEVAPARNYKASVVVEGRCYSLSLFDWDRSEDVAL